jgi:Ca-activated chloride channel family protein
MSILDKLKEKLLGKKKPVSHLDEIKRKRSLQLYEAAVAYYKKKDYENSRRFFEKALQYDPDNQDAKHNLNVVKRQIEMMTEQKR